MHRNGIFQETGKRLQPLGTDGAIDNAMITRKRHFHLVDHFIAKLGVSADKTLGGAANGQDARLGRVDDCREVVNAHHAQVRDCERATNEFG